MWGKPQWAAEGATVPIFLQHNWGLYLRLARKKPLLKKSYMKVLEWSLEDVWYKLNKGHKSINTTIRMKHGGGSIVLRGCFSSLQTVLLVKADWVEQKTVGFFTKRICSSLLHKKERLGGNFTSPLSWTMVSIRRTWKKSAFKNGQKSLTKLAGA